MLRLSSHASTARAFFSLGFKSRIFFFILRAPSDEDDDEDEDEEDDGGLDGGPPGGIFEVKTVGPAPAADVFAAGGGVCEGAAPPAFAGCASTPAPAVGCGPPADCGACDGAAVASSRRRIISLRPNVPSDPPTLSSRARVRRVSSLSLPLLLRSLATLCFLPFLESFNCAPVVLAS